MKFRFNDEVRERYSKEVRVGDVYPAKGGARRKIAMWVVLNIHNGMVHLVGLNEEGVMTSTTSYGVHAMEERELIGRVEGLEELEFVVVPVPYPPFL